MNRSSFIKSVFSLTGTAFVYGCSDSFTDVLPSMKGNISLVPTLKESKEWFANVYMPQFSGPSARVSTQVDPIIRKLNWEDSIESLNY